MSKSSGDLESKNNRGAAESGSNARLERTRSRRRQRVATAALGAPTVTGGITSAFDGTAESSEVNVGRLAISLAAHDGLKLDTCEGSGNPFSYDNDNGSLFTYNSGTRDDYLDVTGLSQSDDNGNENNNTVGPADSNNDVGIPARIFERNDITWDDIIYSDESSNEN